MRFRGAWAALAGAVWLALCGVSHGGGAPPARTAWSTQVVDEPVFGSHVYVAQAGVGNPTSVVLVHGVGDDASQVWDALVPALAEKYHVLTFDLPGFGRSSKPDAVYSPTALAAFVKWAVDRFVKGRFVLVGHSLGGAVALRYAATYPDRLDRLVLADVAGVLHRLALTRELLSTDLAGRGPSGAEAPLRYVDGLVKSALARLPSLALDVGAAVENPYLRETLLGGEPGRVAALALSEEDFTQAVYGVNAPTLVLWGSQDRTASLRTASVLGGSLAHATVRFFDGAGHEPMRDQPELFRKTLLDWLALRNPQKQARREPPAGVVRDGRCEGEQGGVFTGDYRRLDIHNCRGVKLWGVTAREVVVEGSAVDLRDSVIAGGDVGLSVRNSTVAASGVAIAGKTAVEISGGRVDLAGVQLTGTRAAVATKDGGKVLFSIGRLRSPRNNGFVHGPLELVPETPL